MPGAKSNPVFRYFENLIDPFRDAPDRMPPSEVLRFYVYYLRQVWPVFLALLVVGLIVALIEVALFSYLGRIVDLAQSTPSAEFFRVHANELIWMAVVALVLRPLFNALHDMLVHQSINPSMTNLIRWQNHRYVLKQSLGFLPERLRRAHRPAHHADRQLAARFGRAGGGCPLARADPIHRQRPGAVRRGRLAPDDPSGAVGVRLRRRPGLLRSPGQAPLGGRLGFALQADGPDRRRLHQHHHAEAVRPHPPGRGLRPRSHRATRPASRNAPGA